METGSNKSLFTLIAVVIFGIFLSLSYWLFQDEMSNVLANVLDRTEVSIDKKLDLMDDYIQYGYTFFNPTGNINIIESDLQSITYSSPNNTFWGDGLMFDATNLDKSKAYKLTYDITKISGEITHIGGHLVLGNSTIKLDGNAPISNDFVDYPNDTLTHHVEVYFDMTSFVKFGDSINGHVASAAYPHYTYIYLQPNREVTAIQPFTVRIENISIREVN
jgi:hypothetical protein